MRDSLIEARRSEGGARVCRRGHLRPLDNNAIACVQFSFWSRRAHPRDAKLVAPAVIASEAKQSISPRKERMDCFVAPLLAMTATALLHLRRHTPPPGLAFGEPDDRLQRSIQYSRESILNLERHGVLERPPSRTMTLQMWSHPCH